ncbi:hypothetical protein CFOL_v3_11020 [Cephalotus follicularis]|uniref:Uncharacterized protein n=1 Tax=Cephalotus follicularis TaxID=3775 RepID=A0A1Q3BHT1_CEPFO|nr:hypothetical protein CFOL_v3_11020 [Cephalotus follicularis]
MFYATFIVLQNIIKCEKISQLSDADAFLVELLILSTSLYPRDNYKLFNTDDIDPAVVTLQVKLFTMKRILFDSGSLADILYKHAFDQLRILTDQVMAVKTPLVGFAGEMVHPLGSIDLSVVVGTAPHQTQVQMTFLVVDTPRPYNPIIGRPGLNLMKAIVSRRHLLVKFPTRFGVGEVRGDQQVVRQCYKTAIMDKGKEKTLPIENPKFRGEVEPECPQS